MTRITPAELARGLLQAIGSVVVPAHCKLCGQLFRAGRSGPACPRCWNRVTPCGGCLCERCGRPLPPAAEPAGDAGEIGEPIRLRCGECRRARPFRRARSFGGYGGELRELIQLFKFAGADPIGAELGRRLGRWLRSQPGYGAADALSWVPLHWRRRRTRGFDQAQVVARAAAGELELPLIRALKRVRHTGPQSELAAPERRRNVRGAFAVRARPLRGIERLILIDDVWTTGATLTECARVLRRAGVREVYLATLARVL